ncbi:unnamed protein product [Brassica oleracea]|uniref:(rape) hypothetical protein n=1 Tax=Brassica napus TaxID=3708 RepID=A0A816LQZ3_BRANA|nr:unnamed protein product [Brassica napus]
MFVSYPDVGFSRISLGSCVWRCSVIRRLMYPMLYSSVE